jgi:hypothetical protein
MPYKDPEKQKEYRKKWYEDHKNVTIKRSYDSKRVQIAKMQKFANDYKLEKGCCRCPENDPVCLDFHHEDPEKKDIAVAIAVNRGWGQKRIQKEIDKCVVICANCHRKLHAHSP